MDNLTLNKPVLCLLIFTDGRPNMLARTMESFTKNLRADFNFCIISDDSGDPDYYKFLHAFHPAKVNVIDNHERRLGACSSIERTWKLIPQSCTHIFHLEDDFTLDRPVDIMDMIWILDHNPRLAEVAMLRHPVNDAERDAGGLVKRDLRRFQQMRLGNEFNGWIHWFEHDINITFNPCLYRRELTDGRYGYPTAPDGEGKFGWKLKEEFGKRFAYFGKMEDEPLITHIGDTRIGTGY